MGKNGRIQIDFLVNIINGRKGMKKERIKLIFIFQKFFDADINYDSILNF